MARGVIFRCRFSYGCNSPALVDGSIRRNKEMVGNVHPVTVGTHAPDLDVMDLHCSIVCYIQFGSFMMNSNTNRCVLLIGFWFQCLPARTWNDDRVICLHYFFRRATGT